MKRLLPLVAAAATLLSGCATVYYSDEGGKSTVEICNRGWYLLNLIPLASGDPDAPNDCKCRMFTQTTTLANNVRMLDWAATERNVTGVKDVTTFTTDESVLFILFKRHTIHTSAELILPDRKEK